MTLCYPPGANQGTRKIGPEAARSQSQYLQRRSSKPNLVPRRTRPLPSSEGLLDNNYIYNIIDFKVTNFIGKFSENGLIEAHTYSRSVFSKTFFFYPKFPLLERMTQFPPGFTRDNEVSKSPVCPTGLRVLLVVQTDHTGPLISTETSVL